MFRMDGIAEAVAEQVARLDAPLPSAPLEEWVQVVGKTQVLINQLTALQTVAVAKVAATEEVLLEDGTLAQEPRPVGHTRLDAPGLVSDLLGVSDQVASRRVTSAARMCSVMPAVVRAMAAGVLDGYRAQVVTEELQLASGEECTAVTDALMDVPHDRLAAETAGPLRQRARRVIGRLAPDVLRRRAERAKTDRGLIRFTDLFGTDEWTARMPVDKARPAWAAVDARARELREDGVCATLEQARLDALVELILGQTTAHFTMHLATPDLTAETAETAEEGTAEEGSVTDGTPADQSSADASLAAAPVLDATATSAEVPIADSRPAPADESRTAGPAAQSAAESTAPAAKPAGSAAAESTAPAAKPAGSAAAESTGPAAETAGTTTLTAETTGPAADGRPTRIDETSTADPASDGARPETDAQLSGWVMVRGFGIPGETALPATLLADLLTQTKTWPMRCHPETGATLAMDDLEGRVTARAGYRPSDALRALVQTRDGHCRFPGCQVAARFCDLDHARPWPAGPTALANLMCLCRRHHRIKQRPGWTVRLLPDGRAEWTDPTGRTRTTHPLDHLGATRLDATRRDPNTGDPHNTPHGDPPDDDVCDPTLGELARHEAALQADRTEATEHPYRQYIDETGWTWTDEQPFSVLEDTHHLTVRQHHDAAMHPRIASDPRRDRCRLLYPAARHTTWADLAPPPF